MSAPTTPVVLAALLNLQTALQGIATSAGCFYDVKASSVVLDPVALDSVPTTETPFLVLDGETGQNDYTTSRPVAIKNDFTVTLYVRIDAAGDDSSRLRTAAWKFYADVERRVALDPQRGGVAMFTYVQWPTFHLGLASQGQVILEIPIRILLQRTYGQP